MRIIETNMDDNHDLCHTWETIEDAVLSGRFDYLNETDEEEDLNYYIEISNNLEEFIENIGYPFLF